MFLIENECKTLDSFSIKNIFYDKMDLKLFYYDVAIYYKNSCDLNIKE